MHRNGEQGFSLLELVVVVTIIAILMAVGMPTLLGSIDRTNDRGAQSDLRRSLVVALAIASDQGGWFRTGPDSASTAISATDMAAGEPAVDYADGVDTDPTENQVGVAVLGATCAEFRMIRRSKSDRYFGLSANRDGRVGYCEGELSKVVSTSPCVGESW